MTRNRILVVDDAPGICDLLVATLERHGHEAAACHSGAEALDLMRATLQPFHLLLADLRMPGMDGIELLKAAKQIEPAMKTIIITAHGTVENAVWALKEGADDYLTKPFDLNEVKSSIEKVLADQTSPEVPQATEPQPDEEKVSVDRALLDRLWQIDRIDSIIQESFELSEPETFASRALPLICGATAARSGALVLGDREERPAQVVAACGPDESELLRRGSTPSHRELGWVWESSDVILIPDTQADPRTRNGPLVAGRASLLVAPLRHEERGLGALVLVAPAFHLSDTQSNFLALLGQRITPYLANAQAYARLRGNSFATAKLLADAVDAKYAFTKGHSVRVAGYARVIGGRAGLSEKALSLLDVAARVHDLGKARINDGIFTKESSLTPEEVSIMQTHPVVSESMLGDLALLKEAAAVVRHHHEYWNGQGYPDGLRSEGIPHLARMLSIADAYDAMTTPRPYRPPLAPAQAATELRNQAGAQFDPKLVRVFVNRAEGPDPGRSGYELG